MSRHYLDHASTSPPRPEVRAAVGPWLEPERPDALPAADPGRVHTEGRMVRAVVEDARQAVAELLGTRPRQVVFTSGATEAVHAAVWGALRAHPGAPVLAAAVEHSCVREASARLAEVVELPVDGAGRIELGAVDERLQQAAAAGRLPAVVHCQLANHEVGTMQPVAEVVELCRRHGVWVHVDAAAAAGHVPIDFDELGADLLSVSAHKLGGPPGCGALLVRRGLRVEPLLLGGQQERGRRAGLENLWGIAGFGAAAAVLAEPGRLAAEAAEARRHTEAVVAAATAVAGVAVLGDPDRHLAHLACLSMRGLEAEPVLLGLDQAGVAVHSGSSCSSEALEPSPVLAAMGVDAERSLRVSVGWSTTDADVDAFAAAFPAVVDRLRALRH